jgi:hypothetical protein
MKLFAHLMIPLLVLFSFTQASFSPRSRQLDPETEREDPAGKPQAEPIHPGWQVTMPVDRIHMSGTFLFDAASLYSYSLRAEGDEVLIMEVLDADGTVLYSSATDSDDQEVPGGAHWDCMETGEYTLLVTPETGATGEVTFTLVEDPGWYAAVSLTRFPELDGRLDYEGDVDYFVFERTGEEMTYEITVEGDSGNILFWVDPEEGQPVAMVEGEELSIVENYPGGDLTELDSYYGVSGPEGTFTVEGEEDGGGGMSTWMIIGIVGGVVSLILIIVAITSLKDGCDSCNDPFGGLGDLGGLSEGCSGN